ncbi:hypothetical protein [Oceanicola sp. 22II-s10i]|uniref:hypothetical protein n=1 Tax=Oceanicola sp. 22II-s10i TaxID=1317116 RepID=UPI00112FF859|nr:hypothetical protein [Oceanicola sp. 22II-s10i]
MPTTRITNALLAVFCVAPVLSFGSTAASASNVRWCDSGQYQDRSYCARARNGTLVNNCGEYVNFYWCYRDSGNHSCRRSGGEPTQFTGVRANGTYTVHNGRAFTYWTFACK